jgi:hypothetical protein
MNSPTQFQKGIDFHCSGRNVKYVFPIPQIVQQIQNGTDKETLAKNESNQPTTGNELIFTAISKSESKEPPV